MAEFSVVGKSVPRVDDLAKVTGQARYTTDVKLPQMLYARILRSPYPHARIISIDASKVEKVAGVKVVATGKDAPDERVYSLQDRYVLARDKVRFVGEPVAAVAANTMEAAEEALELIEVQYEELPAVFDVEEAMQPNPRVVLHPGLAIGPLLKQYDEGFANVSTAVTAERPNVFTYAKIRHGDTEKGFRESDVVIEGRYTRARVAHCQLEPHAAVAQPDGDGSLTIWVTTQSLYAEKEMLCRLFKLPSSKVRVIALNQGGGFGGRAGAVVVAIPIAALLALKAKQPVKLVYARDEMFIDGQSEVPVVVYIKDGFKRDGTLVAREVQVIGNSGAYSGTNATSPLNAGYAVAGTYRVPNLKCDAYMVATNEEVSGPFRGYLATGPTWAIESHMDVAAERLGRDPVTIRLKNVLKEGEKDPLGQTVYNIGLEECLHKAAASIEWDRRPDSQVGVWKKGKGIAMSNKMTVGRYASSVIVKVHHDGMIEVRHSAVDLGQGCNTSLAQLAAQEFATSVDKVKIVSTDTAVTPYDFGTVSNRVLWHTGNALLLACKDVKRQMLEKASVMLKAPPENLAIEDGTIYHKGKRNVAIRFASLFSVPGMYLASGGELLGKGAYVSPVSPADAETGQGERLVAFYSYGADAAEVAVNVETGEVKVLRATGCFDMAQPVNPKICEQQTEGGIGQGIGGALYEEVIIDNGVVMNPNFLDYKQPSMLDIPAANITALSATPVPHREGPFGAKGFAEGGIVPMAPAIGNAIYDAVGVRVSDLPITKEKVLKALKEKT